MFTKQSKNVRFKSLLSQFQLCINILSNNSGFHFQIKFYGLQCAGRPCSMESQIAALGFYRKWKCPFIKVYNCVISYES